MSNTVDVYFYLKSCQLSILIILLKEISIFRVVETG